MLFVCIKKYVKNYTGKGIWTQGFLVDEWQNTFFKKYGVLGSNPTPEHLFFIFIFYFRINIYEDYF